MFDVSVGTIPIIEQYFPLVAVPQVGTFFSLVFLILNCLTKTIQHQNSAHNPTTQNFTPIFIYSCKMLLSWCVHIIQYCSMHCEKKGHKNQNEINLLVVMQHFSFPVLYVHDSCGQSCTSEMLSLWFFFFIDIQKWNAFTRTILYWNTNKWFSFHSHSMLLHTQVQHIHTRAHTHPMKYTWILFK